MQSALHISTMPCFTAFEKEPVKESEFEAYVEGMHGNENHGFSLEYSVIIFFKPLFPFLHCFDACSSLEEKPIKVT